MTWRVHVLESIFGMQIRMLFIIWDGWAQEMGWRMSERNGVQWNLSHPCNHQGTEPPPLPSHHFSPCCLTYGTPSLYRPYFMFQIPPNNICPTIVLQLLSLCLQTYCHPHPLTHPVNPNPLPACLCMFLGFWGRFPSFPSLLLQAMCRSFPFLQPTE